MAQRFKIGEVIEMTLAAHAAVSLEGTTGWRPRERWEVDTVAGEIYRLRTAARLGVPGSAIVQQDFVDKHFVRSRNQTVDRRVVMTQAEYLERYPRKATQ